MASPNKRARLSPADDDYVSLNGTAAHSNEDRYGYNKDDFSRASTAPQAMQEHRAHHHSKHNAQNDPRNAKDRPKSKHALAGSEPWILIKTKYGRRFVHNTDTKESFWHIPQEIMQGVREFEEWERQQKEREANAKWAEQQLREMRNESKAEDVNAAARQDPRSRRRRSESLQREDEAAMLAELAAEAERAEEEDVKEVVENVGDAQPVRVPQAQGYASDSSYEEVEVTDSEFEDDENDGDETARQNGSREAAPQSPGAMELGEDDIAWQLAAMNEDEDIEEEHYDEDGEDEQSGADDDEDALSPEDAANLFRDMLDDHHISPFTPWDKVLADESDAGIIMDDRYTILPNMRTRKEVWEGWVKDTAARLQEERARMEKLDPRIPYLAFLADNATPKLYWPEFRRKFKKEAVLNDRKLSDKDREKLYRDHINRLKLPESTRKADLIALLSSVPLRHLHKHTRRDALPQHVLTHLHFISLSASIREEVVLKHISTLPAAPDEDGDGPSTAEQRAEENKKREERRRREQAMAERARKVDEDRRKAEKEEQWAKRDLRDEERELRRAMKVGTNGIKTHLND